MAWDACAQCGAVQASKAAAVRRCRVCRSELERTTGRSLDAALALSAATLLLLIPANLAPFLTASVLGAVRQSRLISGPAELWREGWPALAGLVAAVTILAPLLRFGLLTAVLGALRLGRRDHWIGPAFRWADRLQPWAMADVAVLALWIAYARLSATVPTRLGVGGACLVGAGLLTLFVRATLNKPDIWRRIRAQRPWRRWRACRGCAACGYLAPAPDVG
ncbi:MAG TPA: paraquat-inducible protein A, partial [Phenylobacterium sp.]|nr:paraquat-inducible protein A [Phenylobacterium sp.]